MNRLKLLGALFLAGFVASGCATKQDSHLSSRSTRELHHVAIGLCEDYPEESRSLAAARRDLELIRTNHFDALRVAFGWDAIESEPGKYDWSFWDDFVGLADKSGIRLIPYVCYTPRWAASDAGENFWREPPKDNAAFADFMKQIVTRYKGKIHSWEIWNEPDNPSYWLGSPEQFAALLQAGARAVREADPSAEIVMGGLAWNLDFLEAILDHSNAIQNVDVINLHNYYETWSGEPLERIPEYIGRAYDLIHQRRDRQAIWLAEAGYSSFRHGAFVSGQFQAHFQSEHTADAQAAALFRVLTLALATEKVSLVAWYRINDLPQTQDVIGDANNRRLGVLDEHGRPKPALRALQFFHSVFAAGFDCIDDETRVEKEIASPAEVHAFMRADGSVVIVAWLRSNVPGTRGSDSSGEAIDSRERKISLGFPFTLPGYGSAFDELGTPRGRISVSPHRGAAELRDLNLRAGKVVVLLFGRASR